MRWLACVLALGLGLATVGPAAAQDDAQLAAWREQLDRAEADVANARQRVDAAETAYVNMRHDRSVRGPEKAKIIAARGEAAQGLAEAQADLDRVRDEARRAGAPPQWVIPDPPDEVGD